MSEFATFHCKKFKGLKIDKTTRLESFTLQEVDGPSEDYAAARAKAKGPNASTTQELIRYSIVSVNGKKVQQPYEGMDKWNGRARAFLIAAYRSVNSAEDAEIGDFLAASTDGEETEAPQDYEHVEPSDDV